MNSLIIILGMIPLALLVLFYLAKSGKFAKKPPPESPDYPYIRERTLLTAHELSLHSALIRALDSQYGVFAKVALANILSIDPELPERTLGSARERIERQSVDFVLCEKDGTDILGVIQLESHINAPDGQHRQEGFVDRALKAAGVPVFRLPVKDSYTDQELRIEITRSLVLNWDKSPRQDEPFSHNGETEISGTNPDSQVLGDCPDCGSSMQVRQVHIGKFAGKHLLICVRYPACKHMRLIKEQAAILQALP